MPAPGDVYNVLLPDYTTRQATLVELLPDGGWVVQAAGVGQVEVDRRQLRGKVGAAKAPKLKPRPRAKKAPKKRKKKPLAAAACPIPRSGAVKPARRVPEKRLKKAAKKKVKKVKKKAAGKRGCPPQLPGYGDFALDLWFPDCGAPEGITSKRERKKLARARQLRYWVEGQIPDRPPRPYSPGAPVLSRRPVNLEGQAKNAIPVARYGDPDLSWFVDPRIAGDQAGKIVVFFSGGKDSLAALLYVIESLLELGLNPSDHVECWHHSVDGRPWFLGGSSKSIWDWPCTEDYCRKICECLQVPLYFSWLEGGLMGEVMKEDRPKGAIGIELPNGEVVHTGGKGDPKTRLSMPPKGPVQKGGRTWRWCSVVAKIDIGRSHLNNRVDLRGKRTLVVSGERAEESDAREHYPMREFEALWDSKAEKWKGRHGARSRYVERWRPIHRWCEIDVWATIYRWRIRPHPAYRLGFGRLSCMTCIFGSEEMWSTIRSIDPKRWGTFVKTEQKLTKAGVGIATIHYDSKKKRGRPLPVFVGEAEPFRAVMEQPRLVGIALDHVWRESPIEDPWKLPAGAFGEDAGPS